MRETREPERIVRKTRRAGTALRLDASVNATSGTAHRARALVLNEPMNGHESATAPRGPDSRRRREILVRLRRIEGQAQGIQRMIEEGRDDDEIVLQLRSVDQAVRSAVRALFQDRLDLCAAAPDRRTAENHLRGLLALIRRYDP